jgi:ParB family chromosome partitioning protein
MAKPALGRGLGALLGETTPHAKAAPSKPAPTAPADTGGTVPPGDRVQMIPLDQIRPCPFQPRREFPQESLEELADSIREQGILQPLLVRHRSDHYELIAGERRWRAAQALALAEVPVMIRSAEDHEVLELALIENLQRDNLNPLEEAVGYGQLIGQFQFRQEDVADKVGKSRAAVANALRLLKLPESVQNHIRHDRLSVGHAKVVLSLSDPEKQNLAAERIVKDGLSVRQAEELVARLQKPAGQVAGEPTKENPIALPDLHCLDLESRLRERFGTKVHLHYRPGKGGYLQIRFFNDDDLDRILQIAGVAVD